MDDKALELAEKTFKAIADKMGIATTEFWPSFIKKQVLEVLVTFLWTCVLITLTAIFAPMCFYWPESSYVDEYFFDVLRWFMRLVGFILCIVTLGSIWESIQQIKYIFNPKYWAFQDVINTLSKLIK